MVEPSPALREFLDKVEERTVLNQVAAAQGKPDRWVKETFCRWYPRAVNIRQKSGHQELASQLVELKKRTQQLEQLKDEARKLPWEIAKADKERKAREEELKKKQQELELLEIKKHEDLDQQIENLLIPVKEKKEFVSIEECMELQKSELEALKSYFLDDLMGNEWVSCLTFEQKLIPFQRDLRWDLKRPIMRKVTKAVR